MKLQSILSRIWKNKYEILEGLINRIFKSNNVEAIAAARMKICEDCFFIDKTGKDCMVPGTAPCCKSCGCALHTATRSLSYSCPKEYWKAVMTEAQEDELNARKKA